MQRLGRYAAASSSVFALGASTCATSGQPVTCSAAFGQAAEADRVRWDARHSGAAPCVAPPLLPPRTARSIVLPRVGRALDVACGTGGVSIWLAQRGLDVTAVDISPVGLDALRGAATEHGVILDTMVGDLSHRLPTELDNSVFDLIVCQRYRAPELYPCLVSALRPGGLLVITVLSEVGHTGGPSKFRAPPRELIETFTKFPQLEVVDWTEGNGVSTLVARSTKT